MDISQTRGKSGLYLCCEDRGNREVFMLDADNKIEVCKVCRRRHYEMSVDVGVVGIDIKGL